MLSLFQFVLQITWLVPHVHDQARHSWESKLESTREVVYLKHKFVITHRCKRKHVIMYFTDWKSEKNMNSFVCQHIVLNKIRKDILVCDEIAAHRACKDQQHDLCAA